MNGFSAYKHTPKMLIFSDYNEFKEGVIQRVQAKYADTKERENSIKEIKELAYETVQNKKWENQFLKIIETNLWKNGQNEYDWIDGIETVLININCSCEEHMALKVLPYFYANFKIPKGMLNLVENMKKTGDNYDEVMFLGCVRELLEETNIKLSFINQTECSLEVYDNKYEANYSYNKQKLLKPTFNICLSCASYDAMKQTFKANKKQHIVFMESSGEIAAISM